jgi:alpha-beta hydrolase superfamily lysophospholipase
MRVFYCTWAILAVLALPGVAQSPADTGYGYIIFLRGVPIGREDISIRSTSEGTTISSRGSAAAPFNTVSRNAELRYAPDGSARSFQFDGSVNGVEVSIRTTISNGTAATQGSESGKLVSLSHPVPAGAVMLPSQLFAGFAALASRLGRSAVGDQFKAFVVPSAELNARLVAVSSDRMQKSTSLFEVRRFDVAFDDGQGEVVIQVTTLPNGDLVRVNIPAQAIDVVRDDIAGATSRTDVYSNPGDQPQSIPAPGFNIGATLTLPSAASGSTKGAERRPAVIFVPSPDAPDRDFIAPGVPAFGQLAGKLAEAGFITLRYDRRGTGQSGGRTESAGIADFADDVRTMAKWLSDRKDIDSKRIAVVGHDTGAWIALLAASRDKRIAAAVTLAAPAVKGVDYVLEQQQLQLNRMRTPAAEREPKITLQRRINTAVLTGKGWDGIAPELRKRADTPMFQSLLAFDPAKVARDVDALLIVHGDLDREIPVMHAETLASAARQGSRETVTVSIAHGVNHLLQSASTGEVGEYATLTSKDLSPDVASAVTGWLQRTLQTQTR